MSEGERFRTIVADPPWDYGSTFTPKLPHEIHQKGAELPYPAMSLDEIESLKVRDLAADNAHLYLWTTNKHMEHAWRIARAWGFDPKVPVTWVKTHGDNRTRVSMKVGHYFRGATEHFLFCVRGSLNFNEGCPALPTAYLWPRLPHSVKPDAFYDLVETASPGPYLELFARRARFGWEYAGDQSLSTVKVEGLAA